MKQITLDRGSRSNFGRFSGSPQVPVSNPNGQHPMAQCSDEKQVSLPRCALRVSPSSHDSTVAEGCPSQSYENSVS
eukprot:4140295-Amphidinium_carterae.1